MTDARGIDLTQSARSPANTKMTMPHVPQKSAPQWRLISRHNKSLEESSQKHPLPPGGTFWGTMRLFSPLLHLLTCHLPAPSNVEGLHSLMKPTLPHQNGTFCNVLRLYQVPNPQLQRLARFLRLPTSQHFGFYAGHWYDDL
jgi:hypothetical protein